jgi:hypothetical protein
VYSSKKVGDRTENGLFTNSRILLAKGGAGVSSTSNIAGIFVSSILCKLSK